jgi:serine/threonine protein kinase
MALTPHDMPAGLAHLHQRKFYHRDLKLENVAVSEGNVVKLIDFGSSTSVAAGTTASATADEEDGGDGGAAAEARTAVISISQKAHTRAPEVVLGQSVKGTPEEQEKVRRITRAVLNLVRRLTFVRCCTTAARRVGPRHRFVRYGVRLCAVRRIACRRGSVRQIVSPPLTTAFHGRL